MPPDGSGDLNVIVRCGKVKGETECRADRSVSTGGYAATKRKKEIIGAVLNEEIEVLDCFVVRDTSAMHIRIS